MRTSILALMLLGVLSACSWSSSSPPPPQQGTTVILPQGTSNAVCSNGMAPPCQ